MNHQINIDEAIAIAKEYHLEAEVTECIKQGMSPIEALIVYFYIVRIQPYYPLLYYYLTIHYSL